MLVLTPSACASSSACPQAATGIRRERQLADVGSLGNIVVKDNAAERDGVGSSVPCFFAASNHPARTK
jgi:hypothetical protein